MKYRVYFSIPSGYFYTEWFDTIFEANDFVIGAEMSEGVIHVIHTEDSDDNIV